MIYASLHYVLESWQAAAADEYIQVRFSFYWFYTSTLIASLSEILSSPGRLGQADQSDGSESYSHQLLGGLSQTHSSQHQVRGRNAHPGHHQLHSATNHSRVHQRRGGWGSGRLQSGIHRLPTSGYSSWVDAVFHQLIFKTQTESDHEVARVEWPVLIFLPRFEPELLQTIPANVLVVSWIPQAELLSE